MLYPPEGERHFAGVVAEAGHQQRQDDTAAPAGHPVSGSMFLMTFVMISMLLGVE